jgi:hypothetical protein
MVKEKLAAIKRLKKKLIWHSYARKGLENEEKEYRLNL